MKLLVYSINYYPELTGIGKYSGEMAERLAAYGHEVRVVTAPPYYPQWRIADGYAGWKFQTEQFGGVTVFRCPLWVPRQPRGMSRLIHLFSFAASSFFALFRQVFWRPQVVVLVVPTLFCAPGAWVFARMAGARAWLHIQDFELDAASALGMLKSRIFILFAQWFERFWLSRFDRVSTISSAMLTRLTAKGVRRDRCVLFPNWVNTRAIYPLDRLSDFRQELGLLNEVVVALYAGNMGEKQGLEIVVEAARQCAEDPNLVFVLAGEGAARGRLEKLAQGLSNVYWLPLQPVDRLNELLNLADIHLLPQQAGAADLVMPSKLTGMLASGRPVIVTAAPNTQLALSVQECGIAVNPGDVSEFSHAVISLANAPEVRYRCGRCARKIAILNYDQEKIIQQFEEQLQLLGMV